MGKKYLDLNGLNTLWTKIKAKITAAIQTLDVTDITGFGAGKTLATLTEADGKISATFQNISITKSQVSDFSHAHGNIQNGGTLQTNDITIANGDKLVVTDSSDTGKVARASISFDGSTTTKALTPKGIFETFSKLTIGTTSTTAAAGNHTHTTSIASDSSSGTVVTLAHNTQYKLTAGGNSVLFKTPAADSNTDTKVTQTKDDSGTTAYPLLLSLIHI